MKKMKCCEYGPRDFIHKNFGFLVAYMNGSNKLECYTTLGLKGKPAKNSNLLDPFISHEESEWL